MSIKNKETEYKEIINWSSDDDEDDGEHQPFESLKPYTKTYVIMTNLKLNIDKLFRFLPIVNYTLIPKKRGRKKKEVQVNPNIDIETGSIITLEYRTEIRGVDLKNKTAKAKKKMAEEKTLDKETTFFRNSLTIVMMIEKKLINFKISNNGKFQLTGCKNNEPEVCIDWIWRYIKDSKEIWTIDGYGNKEYEDSDTDIDTEDEFGNVIEKPKIVKIIPILKATFIPAMRNIFFMLGFYVDREKLDVYMNTYTDYRSLLETSFVYPGVNIKVPYTKPITELILKQLTFSEDQWINLPDITYTDYLDMLPVKDSRKKLRKKRYFTFLVFHSGKVIMSGLDFEYMKPVYYMFLDIIKECRSIVEEKLDSIV
jgi:TATA-box binding protein (TBP) (component of TFIID and TFIIIB)